MRFRVVFRSCPFRLFNCCFRFVVVMNFICTSCCSAFLFVFLFATFSVSVMFRSSPCSFSGVFAVDRFRVRFSIRPCLLSLLFPSVFVFVRFHFLFHVYCSSLSFMISFASSFSVTFSFLLIYAFVVVRCRGHSRFRPFCVFVRFRFRFST